MTSRTGRPAAFDRTAALRGAVLVFWERGYHATSLPELLAAMGIARSSFYASFGSKHRVLLEALDLYTEELYIQMEQAASRSEDPGHAVLSALDVVACSVKPAHGCLFINTVAELAPSDPEIVGRARTHLERVRGLFARLLRRSGHPAGAARQRAGAIVALAQGAVLLRKAGRSEADVRSVLGAASSLLER